MIYGVQSESPQTMRFFGFGCRVLNLGRKNPKPRFRISVAIRRLHLAGLLYQEFSKNVTAWLGREDSNLRMVESKSTALPLGDAPIDFVETGAGSPRGFPLATPVY